MRSPTATQSGQGLVPPRVYAGAWTVALTLALTGMVAIGATPGTRQTGYALLAVGGGSLALCALGAEFRTALARDRGAALRLVVVTAGGLAFVAAVAFAADVVSTGAPLAVRLVALAAGFQALLLTVDIRAARRSRRARAMVLLSSHGTLFAGALLTLSWGRTVPRAGLLLYASGFAALLLNAFWARTTLSRTVPPEPETDRRRWEAVLLLAIVGGVLGAIVMVLGSRTGTLTLGGVATRAPATVTGVAALVALATVGAPRTAPSVLRWLDGSAATVVQHVLVLFVVANGLLLGVFVAARWLLLPVLGVFLAAIAVSVGLNYATLAYSSRRAGHDDGGRPADGGVTVVVAAANEFDVLSESLRENVARLDDLPFLLVPAARSTDGTKDLMAEVRNDHPDRVRVVEGTGGSKAADLNQVWDHVETPHVLVLDADETLDRSFVTRALSVLAERPEVGIVQGRKLATYPDASRLSRFISVERQHSTWLDHPFDATVLKSGHFAGSAALLRTPVVPDAGGFSPEILTEDIDLTLRLYLETDWDVAYAPDLVARELLPGTWTALLGQRERWSRGWAQVAGRYFGDVLGSWRKLGLRRTLGLSYILFIAVSAPLYTLFPALVLPTVTLDAFAGPPLLAAVFLALLLLPERAVSFAWAVFRDPAQPTAVTPRRVVGTVCYAYLWVLFGWIVQLHALYLQLSGAPRTWTVTPKMRSTPPAVDTDTARLS